MPRKSRARVRPTKDALVQEGPAPYGDDDNSRLKHTEYFHYTRLRPDRAAIRDEWILHTVNHPIHTEVQTDGRLRRWAWIAERRRYLRVILLADGLTVHNVFFDRSFKPPAQ
jgi:hypothetical protein